MGAQITALLKDFDTALSRVKTPAEAANLKADYIGKKGRISEILRSLKDASQEEKKILGAETNEAKEKITAAIDTKMKEIELSLMNEKLKKDWQDVTLRNSIRERGLIKAAYHPLAAMQREVEDIFISMGFDILDGPHIEDEFHNFEALNLPADHPARDLQDTFYFKDGDHLLRTQTSTIQIRGMREKKPPFKFVGPGKVFRCEATDPSHEFSFHQIEGMMVAEDINSGHLVYFLKTLLSEIFREEIDVRLRHGYFPFVEPGYELDLKCLICHGKGCPVCKNVGWIEFLGCGMVHPNVLRYGNVDPKKFNGFAFGLGLDRLVMMRYGIDDIRHFQSGDLRFVSQFSDF